MHCLLSHIHNNFRLGPCHATHKNHARLSTPSTTQWMFHYSFIAGDTSLWLVLFYCCYVLCVTISAIIYSPLILPASTNQYTLAFLEEVKESNISQEMVVNTAVTKTRVWEKENAWLYPVDEKKNVTGLCEARHHASRNNYK